MRNEDADLIGGEDLAENSVYKLLFKNLPAFRNDEAPGKLHCRKLAKSLGISYQALYKWFKRGSIPPKQVYALIRLPDSQLELEDILPFVID